ncbi:hypothetical protein EU538_06475 [Candidatus Thorarchaeota archaeon]|nr:MAG: hypothetical protein EU538_06475 [Candidatus Thorarchaeota archaeon]
MEDNPPTFRQKLTKRLLDGMGCLVPLFQSIPYGYWGLMSAPFILFLVGIVAPFPSGLVQLPWRLSIIVATTPLALIGFVFLIYSVGYFLLYKNEGLVTKGPYRFIRHPQYLGVLLFTIPLTLESMRLYATDGPSYFTRQAMVFIWYLQLLAYVVLAVAEEQYILRTHGKDYAEYIQRTGFLFPCPIRGVRWFDIGFSITLLVVVMNVSLLLSGYIHHTFFYYYLW